MIKFGNAISVALNSLLMCVALIGVVSVPKASAQTSERLPNPYDAFRLADMTPDSQLPLLGDRFRIDDHIDEITMVFFRQTQSRPVVLILPDGSKWYSSRHPEHVRWESGPGFDQVRIQNPMRGPWQVSGELRSESRLMVISDLTFQADPLPELIFRGERLAVTGRFSEAGEPIEQRDFRNAIEMQMYLVSTNSEKEENFGLNPRLVGEFVDDGRGLDARARDGEFTGEIDFSVPTGSYIPSYRAHTPLYQRTFEQPPIRITRLPVTTNVDVSEVAERSHRLEFSINDAYFDPADIVLRGEVEFPNGEVQLIDIRTKQGDSLVQRIPNYVTGLFSVRATLYATSRHDGREIVAQLDDYEFISRQPEPQGPSDEELMQQRLAEREAAAVARIEAEQQAQRSQVRMLMMIIAFNLLLATSWIVWLLWRKGIIGKRGAKPAKKGAKKAKK